MLNKFTESFAKSSLYKNSFYLMLGTFIMAVLGFIYWTINTRLYSVEQVGIGTTIISIMSLVTNFSVLGLNSALIRYLPKSENRNRKINTAFLITTLITILLSVVFILFIQQLAPKLFFLRNRWDFALIFLIFMGFSASSFLIDSIFIAYRSSQFVLIKHTVFSFLKIIFIFLFLGFGAFGIFLSWSLALTIACVISIIILKQKFQYKFFPKIDSISFREMFSFSSANYAVDFIRNLPTMLFPLMITNILNSETTAYYFIAMMIANILYIIPQSINQSVFAEGSHDDKAIREHITKGLKIISATLVPAIIITIIFGKFVLVFFGKSYAEESFSFLKLLAIAGIFLSANNMFEALFKVKKKMKPLLFSTAFGVLITILLSYFLLKPFGLYGIGVAWIIGQIVTLIGYFIFYKMAS